MIKLDTQSHRTTLFANHNLTWASPRSPSTAHCPPDAFAVFFNAHLLVLFGRIIPGSAMAMAYRSYKGRKIGSQRQTGAHGPPWQSSMLKARRIMLVIRQAVFSLI
jgi:hypothetical protein